MYLDRRSLLASLCWMAASPAFAAEAPPELDSYERESGGRIGIYAENLATGAKLAWRADERFVMCSTFKASLVACVLARVDRGEEKLAEMIPYNKADLLEYAPVAKQNLAAGAMSVSDMCKASVELSDNTCANLLLARIADLPHSRRSGDQSVTAPRGSTTTSPNSTARRPAIPTTPPRQQRWSAISSGW